MRDLTEESTRFGLGLEPGVMMIVKKTNVNRGLCMILADTGATAATPLIKHEHVLPVGAVVLVVSVDVIEEYVSDKTAVIHKLCRVITHDGRVCLMKERSNATLTVYVSWCEYFDIVE